LGTDSDVAGQHIKSIRPETAAQMSAMAGSFGAPFELRLRAARDGSVAALRSLFEECRNYLLLIANRELGATIQAKFGASDLIHATFGHAQHAFERFEGNSREELAAWLAKILAFKLTGASQNFLDTRMKDSTHEHSLRDRNSEISVEGRSLSGRGTEEVDTQIDEFEELKRILVRLPDDYRLAIKLRSLERKSFADLGRTLQCSADAARMTWTRALVRLLEELRSTRPNNESNESFDDRLIAGP
jgi:RNA polymerase sigma factor (sigma-70 family)